MNTNLKKLPGYSILEVIVSTIIILICVLIFSTMINRLLSVNPITTKLRNLLQISSYYNCEWNQASSVNGLFETPYEQQVEIKTFMSENRKDSLTLYKLRYVAETFHFNCISEEVNSGSSQLLYHK